MTDAPGTELRVALEAERARVAARLSGLRGNFDEYVEGAEYVNTDDEHDPEGATIAFARAQVIALRDEAAVQLDPLFGPMFNDVAKVDWPEHLVELTAFWSRALLNEPGSAGNPFRAHVNIHVQQCPVQAAASRAPRFGTSCPRAGVPAPLAARGRGTSVGIAPAAPPCRRARPRMLPRELTDRCPYASQSIPVHRCARPGLLPIDRPRGMRSIHRRSRKSRPHFSLSSTSSSS